MANTVALGVAGLVVPPGSHICVLARGSESFVQIEERILRQGLLNGEVCLGVLEDPARESPLRALAEESSNAGRLHLISSWEAFLGRGAFSPLEMVEHLSSSVGAALSAAGCSFARTVGEMSAALREIIGEEQLMQYEFELNRSAARHPQLLLCMYDLDGFSGSCLVEILRTHPWVLLGDALINNPYYVSPDEFLATRV
jgi:hypothetical protein